MVKMSYKKHITVKQSPRFITNYDLLFSHQVSAPNTYRGKYRDTDYSTEELTELYLDELREVISKLGEEGKHPAAFIAESMQSCGGQVIYPKKYLLRAQR